MIAVGIVAAGQRVASTGGGGSLPVSGATLHLDASTLALSGGAAIATWSDLSGAGNHATQATSTSRPTFVASGINGLGTVNYSQSVNRQYFDLPNFLSGVTAGEIFVVVKGVVDPPTGDSTTSLWYLGSDAALSTHYPFTDGKIYDTFGTTARKSVGDPGPLLTDTHVYHAASAAGLWFDRIDGGTIYSTTTNTVGWATAPKLGANAPATGSAGAWGFNGQMGEVVFYPFTLTDTQRADVVNYLAAKWGTSPTGTPASGGPPVSGYRLRYDATALAGYSDTDAVPVWHDLSGYNHDAGKRSTTAPRYRSAGINSLPCIEFGFSGSATDYRISVGALADCTAAEIFAVIQSANDPSDGTSKGGLWQFGPEGVSSHHPWTSGDVYEEFGTSSRKLAGDPASSLATAHVYHVRSAASDYAVRVNNASLYTSASNTVAWNTAGFRIGQGGDGGFWFNGKIGEILVYPSTLTSTQRDDIYNYLKTKWGTP